MHVWTDIRISQLPFLEVYARDSRGIARDLEWIASFRRVIAYFRVVIAYNHTLIAHFAKTVQN